MMELDEIKKLLVALLHSLDCSKEVMMVVLSFLTTEEDLKTMIQWLMNHQQAQEEEILEIAEKIKERNQ